MRRLAGFSFLSGIRNSVFPVIRALPEDFLYIGSLEGEPLPQNQKYQNKIDKGNFKVPGGFHKWARIHKTMEII